MTNRKKIRAWVASLKLFELRLRVKSARARNAYIRAAAYLYEKDGQPPAHLNNRHARRVAEVLQSHYTQVIPHFARMGVSQVVKIDRKAAFSFSEAMAAWIAREALRKAKMIADTDRDDIIDAIGKGVAAGEGTAAIAKRIRQVGRLTTSRANLISRTETHAAATYGSIQGVREAEVELGVTMLKSWAPTPDARTRPEHAAMASSPPIPLDEKFIVGGEEMDRPGDPSASAGNVLACRCALIYQEKE